MTISEQEYVGRIRILDLDLVLEPTTFIDLGKLRPLFRYDQKQRRFHTYPYHYARILEWFSRRNQFLKNDIDHNWRLIHPIRPEFGLRDYQKKALDSWMKAGNQGVVVIATGGGKTYIAMKAIAELSLKTLIIVPTIDLLRQWQSNLENNFRDLEFPIGIYGAGKKNITQITVTTYQSAFIHLRDFQREFNFVIFDEVHHLFAPSFQQIAQGLVAENRLGLTATFDPIALRYADQQQLVGSVVCNITPQMLRESQNIADYRIEKIMVDLNPRERKAYNKNMQVYRDYLGKTGLAFRNPEDFQKLVLASGRNEHARQALLAHNQSRRIAFSCSAKQDMVEELLVKHAKDKVVIFSEFNDTILELSRNLLLPCITHNTRTPERTKILDGFREGKLSKLASSKVLDEGVDIHDVSIGIVMSGSGVQRQAIQRLGRLLRKKPVTAILYEIMSRDTMEIQVANRRNFEKSHTEIVREPKED